MDIIGKRVRIKEEVENYPTIFVEAGAIGTVTYIDDEMVWVKLDEYHAELDEWDNQLHVWNWTDRPVADLVEIISAGE